MSQSHGVPITSGPEQYLDLSWEMFGELCRALAFKVTRDFEPEVVVGVARAGAGAAGWAFAFTGKPSAAIEAAIPATKPRRVRSALSRFVSVWISGRWHRQAMCRATEGSVSDAQAYMSWSSA